MTFGLRPSDQLVCRNTLRVKEKFTEIFSGAEKHEKLQVMNILRHSMLVKDSQFVGTAYKSFACDRNGYILFTLGSQRVTLVGTLCAGSQTFLGMGASEQQYQ